MFVWILYLERLANSIIGVANDIESPQFIKIPDEVVENKIINGEIEKFAGGNGTNRGTGGMVTKLNAAKLCMENNINLVIAHGGDMDNIERVVSGKTIGTLFAGSLK